MRQLLNIFVDMCLLRAAPQDLPASPFLLGMTLLAGLVTGTVVIVETFGGLANALLAQLLDFLLLLSLLWVALGMVRHRARFLQAATALCGSGVVINLVIMPLQLLLTTDPSGSLTGELAVLLYLGLIAWSLVVVGHIVRHAFEFPLWGGILVAMNYFFLANWLIQTLFFPD
ncbi:MAG: hypothetical protein KDI63_04720 [Gammaproteobacteria bacterium]|nr:hypothetical protein [Gammaproteobacteria bacterium]